MLFLPLSAVSGLQYFFKLIISKILIPDIDKLMQNENCKLVKIYKDDINENKFLEEVERWNTMP